jgi:hypothetical protein
VLGLALLIAGPAAGCGESGSPDRATSGQNTAQVGSAPPSPSATPPEDLCAQLIAHWSRKTLTGDTYGDYQSTGLSNGQYEILMKVVNAARKEQERAGTKAAQRLIDRTARELCVDRYSDGGPTGGPWQ